MALKHPANNTLYLRVNPNGFADGAEMAVRAKQRSLKRIG